MVCRRQFLIGPMGGVIGLRPEGVKAIFDMKQIELSEQAALFDDLQMMADAAAVVLNAKG
jgi:hypothetical protein